MWRVGILSWTRAYRFFDHLALRNFLWTMDVVVRAVVVVAVVSPGDAFAGYVPTFWLLVMAGYVASKL